MAVNLQRSTLEESPALRRLRAVLPQDFQRHVRSARELDRDLREARRADSESSLPTAVPALDRLLDGGLPRGQLVELVGSRTSGRFSTVLATLAAATGSGERGEHGGEAAAGAGAHQLHELAAGEAAVEQAVQCGNRGAQGCFGLSLLGVAQLPVELASAADVPLEILGEDSAQPAQRRALFKRASL